MSGSRPRTMFGTLATLTAAAALVWLVLSGGGDVARAQYGGSTPVRVSAYGCIDPLGLFGTNGHVTTPAGSEILIGQGYSSSAPGGVKAFLDAETTLLSVNDALMIDVSHEWVEVPQESGALARLIHPTGIVLEEPGDSMRFTFALTSKRRLLDPSDYDGDGRIDPQLGGPGLMFGGTCTVTAV